MSFLAENPCQPYCISSYYLASVHPSFLDLLQSVHPLSTLTGLTGTGFMMMMIMMMS